MWVVRALLAATTQETTSSPSGGDFRWYQAIPWILTGCALLFGVWQWVRTRKLWAKVWCNVERGGAVGSEHKRFLVVAVLNIGADLYDLSVTLDWTEEGRQRSE